MIETVTSGVGAIASSAMPCSVQLRTERAAALPTRTDPPMAASTALFSSTLQLEQSAMSNGPCTAGQAHREASMSEATAHSVHTLTLTREFASWRVPPVISIASTCRASTGSFAQHNAVFDGKDRSNRHPVRIIRKHHSCHDCDLNSAKPRPHNRIRSSKVRTVLLSVLAIVLPSSSSVPALTKATAPRSCTCGTYPHHMTARSKTHRE